MYKFLNSSIIAFGRYVLGPPPPFPSPFHFPFPSPFLRSAFWSSFNLYLLSSVGISLLFELNR